jgi:hypothetical protein
MEILPEHIRANLATYQKHQACTCLQCGYVGMMGVHTSEQKFSNALAIGVGVVLIGLLIMIDIKLKLTNQPGLSVFWYLAAGGIGALITYPRKVVLACPNCNSGVLVK